MEERIGWQGQSESQIRGEKRSGRLVGAAETSKKLAKWRRLQQRNLNILGLLKRKEWSRYHRESSWQVCRSRPCQKEKEQSRLSRVPDHEGGERVRVSESRTLERKREIRTRAWRGKGGLHSEERQVPRRKERASKKSLPRGSRRKHERVSRRKSSPGQSAEYWFHSMSRQT